MKGAFNCQKDIQNVKSNKESEFLGASPFASPFSNNRDAYGDSFGV